MEINLKIGLNPRGKYSPSTTYNKLDVVYSGYNSYVSVADNNTNQLVFTASLNSNVVTVDENYWIPLTDDTAVQKLITDTTAAKNAANTAATAFANAIVQVTGSETDKVMSQKATTDAIAAIQQQFDTLLSGSASTAIDTFNEIIAFLANLNDSSTLEGIISAINTTIANNLATSKNYADSAVTTHNASTTAHADLFAKKVDKVEGKGLSTNDYDNPEKAQVSTNKETNVLQDTVTAEALAKLINEVNALKKIIAGGKLGDVHATSLTSDTVPQYCGQQMIIKGSGSPVTNAVTPDFEGQIYIDTTNRNAYMCCDSSSYSYWKLLN